jgi:hypothetical protein
MVCSAQAGERWPANVCKDIQGLRTIIESHDQTASDRADMRFAVLLMQEVHCSVDVRAARAADRAALSQDTAPKSSPKRRSPILCDTTPKAYGGSTTDCF